MEKTFWEKVIIDYSVEFHLLRHFVTPSKSCQLRLIEKGISIEKIKFENEIPGSKFFDHFATDIFDLLLIVKNISPCSETEFNNAIYLNYSFEKSEFPQGIGINSLIKKYSLTNKQIAQIYFSEIRGIPLQYLKSKLIPICWNLTIILKQLDSDLRLTSAFPGEPGLPIPANSMDNKTKQECIRFWNEHVILVM